MVRTILRNGWNFVWWLDSWLSAVDDSMLGAMRNHSDGEPQRYLGGPRGRRVRYYTTEKVVFHHYTVHQSANVLLMSHWVTFHVHPDG